MLKTHSHGTRDNCRKKITNKIVKKNEFIDCHQDYWPLKPKIFSTFDDVFIIICTDNEPPVQWFLIKFENRHTLINLFWWYIKLSIRDELMCSGRVGSSCTSTGTGRPTIVTNPVVSHEWGKTRNAITTNGTYPW